MSLRICSLLTQKNRSEAGKKMNGQKAEKKRAKRKDGDFRINLDAHLMRLYANR